MLCCGILIACYAHIKFDDATPTPYEQYAISTRYYPIQMRSLSWFRLDILFVQNKFSLLLVSSSKSEFAFSQQSYYLLLLFFPLEVLFGVGKMIGCHDIFWLLYLKGMSRGDLGVHKSKCLSTPLKWQLMSICCADFLFSEFYSHNLDMYC